MSGSGVQSEISPDYIDKPISCCGNHKDQLKDQDIAEDIGKQSAVTSLKWFVHSTVTFCIDLVAFHLFLLIPL